MKIRMGDTVLVISGKDKGKTGTVMRVLGNRLVVGDINMRTRHIKKTPQQAGQRIRYEASIAVSNVMLLDAKTRKPTRIGMRTGEKGRKIRFAKGSGEAIVAAAAPAKKSPKVIRNKSAEAGKKQDVPEAGKTSVPSKKPFWKRLSFGAEAVQEDLEDPRARVPDKSVPEQTRTPESFSHSRGS